MFKKILIGFPVLVAALVVLIMMQPDEFSVSRSAAFNAPPAAVFEQVNNLQNWEDWSPWARLDPDAKGTYEGPAAGTGAKMSWDGNSQVGAGTMTISESKPDELVRLQLDFTRPFKSTSTAIFTFEPQGNQIVVTWTMHGHNNFIGKAISLLMDCEKMVGGQFEEGLNNMKAVVES